MRGPTSYLAVILWIHTAVTPGMRLWFYVLHYPKHSASNLTVQWHVDDILRHLRYTSYHVTIGPFVIK